MKMKLTIDKVLFAALVIALGYNAYPTGEQKQAGGLRLNRPVETPDGVYFSWLGGHNDATYTIYRSYDGGETWTPLVSGLTGQAGNWMYQGFTLDKDYSYRIQAE